MLTLCKCNFIYLQEEKVLVQLKIRSCKCSNIFTNSHIYIYSVNTYVRPLIIGSPNLRLLSTKFHNIWLKFYCQWYSSYFNHSKIFIERSSMDTRSEKFVKYLLSLVVYEEKDINKKTNHWRTSFVQRLDRVS